MNKFIILFLVLLSCNTIEDKSKCIDTYDISATYYNITGTTSCGDTTAKGCIALSRDLYEFFECRDTLYLQCDCILEGRYTVLDKTHKDFNNRVDIFIPKNVSDTLPLDQGIYKGIIFKLKNI